MCETKGRWKLLKLKTSEVFRNLSLLRTVETKNCQCIYSDSIDLLIKTSQNVAGNHDQMRKLIDKRLNDYCNDRQTDGTNENGCRGTTYYAMLRMSF